jgi:hypothetical protein
MRIVTTKGAVESFYKDWGNGQNRMINAAIFPKETTMHNSFRSVSQGTLCAVCKGKFGLVRYYSWRAPLCSKKCIERFRSRRASDCDWLSWLQVP